jgi:hypothetical protein
VLTVFSDSLTHNVLEGWPTVLASASQLLSCSVFVVCVVLPFVECELLAVLPRGGVWGTVVPCVVIGSGRQAA